MATVFDVSWYTMRIALIHYWLVNWRGGEQVLRAIADLYPDADVFTHVADPAVAAHFAGHRIRSTFVGRLPGAVRHYQKYLPLMPLALEQLDLREYDLVISSESGPAKGVITHPYARHLCYCHSPMRYAWDMYHDYTAHRSVMARALMAPLLHYMRSWDQLSAQRVDAFAANSAFVSRRIAKYYRRDSRVVFPPVAVEEFNLPRKPEGFFLWVGQLVRYKRPDILVEAFNQLGERLVVIGDGEMLASLRKHGRSNIEFLGKQSFDVLREHYSKCRALVFPGVEDFGIVPVEAMASGAPVIALGAGGALETVEDGRTGVFYSDNSVAGLLAAVARFRDAESRFDSQYIRRHAEKFSANRFRTEFAAFVDGSGDVPSVSVAG